MVVFFVFVCNYSLALSVYHKFGDFSRDFMEMLSSRFDGVILRKCFFVRLVDVEMMGLIGAGNNPMVGMTVAVAVAIEEACK